MISRRHPAPAERAPHIMRLAAFMLGTVGILAVVLIATGVFDPKPYGSLIRTDHPGLRTSSGPGADPYPQPAPWHAGSVPTRYSVRLSAALREGETDSGYGLALTGPTARLVVAVSPLGYAAVLEDHDSGEPVSQLPWQPWPHVRTGSAANEIWLDVDQEDTATRVTAWVNRERLWQGELDGPAAGVELWQMTFGRPATVDFQALEWYVPQSSATQP